MLTLASAFGNSFSIQKGTHGSGLKMRLAIIKVTREPGILTFENSEEGEIAECEGGLGEVTRK